MELKISNFAKIKEANIKLDGITVIAGENNTGKSTIGKILFSMFNSLKDIDGRIEELRNSQIEISILGWCFQYKFEKKYVIAKNILKQLVPSYDFAEVRNVIKRTLNIYEKNRKDLDVDELTEKVFILLKAPKESVRLELIRRYFYEMFHGQINPLNNSDSESIISLSIKNNPIRLKFMKNECEEYERTFEIQHKAILIDNPFIMDELNPSIKITSTTDKMIYDLVHMKSEIDDNLFTSVMAKDKLKKIFEIMNNAINGDVIQTNDGEFYYKDDSASEPLNVCNLSTGLKSFALLKLLLERGLLENRDVIIFDEPEIHLHPQWQVVYAETIVLLQKYFDLTIVVTTHSPYFLDAITLFSKKHELDNKCNYYLSGIDEDNVKIENVNDHLDLIYQKMASPLDILNTIRYDLENQEN